MSATGSTLALRETEGGIAFSVRLTPKSSGDRIAGLLEGPDGPVLAARVRAVAEKGKANTALTKLIATWIGVPRSSVRLIAGTRSRYKRIEVRGDPAELADRITELLDHG